MPETGIRGRRIMVVEDEYYLADELDDGLRMAGATILGPVPSVQAALALIEEAAPELAVLDMNLGGEMAYPVADALAARRIPFVITTGYDPVSLPERFAAARRVEKPVELPALLKEVEALLAP